MAVSTNESISGVGLDSGYMTDTRNGATPRAGTLRTPGYGWRVADPGTSETRCRKATSEATSVMVRPWPAILGMTGPR